jgi:hypothetical protein
MPPLPFQLISSTPDFALATLGAVVMLVWKAQPTLAGVLAARDAILRHGAANPEGIGLMVVLEAHAPLPPPPVREAMISVIQSKTALLAMVAIHGRAGFAAAAVRSVVAGLSLIKRKGPAMAFVATEQEGVMWLSAELSLRGISIPPRALREALGDLRAAKPDGAPPG